MAVVCPYCDQRLTFPAAPPGRYRPDCPNCHRPFSMTVPAAGTAWPVRADTSPELAASGSRSAAVHDTPRAQWFGGAVPSGITSVALPALAPAPSGFARTNPDVRRNDARPPAAADRPPPPEALFGDDFRPPPADVRGYVIERELGRGGMGSVYLARQLSLDRPVALKVMSQRWATDPVFVARFTREAYAAALLCHPNIVAIYDIGETDGTRFFSMEYVPGQSLADVVKRQGKVDPEAAVGYVLQAARGLKHAHDRGMIHRDVKPDNLLVDKHGLVKVADLGLVKTPVTTWTDDQLDGEQRSGLNTIPPDMTGARIALGTPAYMSPEQCRDAAAVDHRADVYSLGCTLYVLVTGRPPFDGNTAVELMTKHAYESLVPPEHIVSRVPKELSAVIQKMMAKDAADRYQDMGEVVRVLEAWLGVWHTAVYTPHENQIGKLEGFAKKFAASPTAALRGRVVHGYFSSLLLAAVLLAFFGKLTWVAGVAGLAVQSTAAYFVLDGAARKGHLFRRVKQFAWGLSWGDWAVAAAGLALGAILLGMLKLFWVWCGFGLIGVGLAFALRYGLDRTADEERGPCVSGAGKLLARLRAQGLDEEELRLFVAKFSGRRWEEFFEALFGFDAKMAARMVMQRGGAAGERDRHAAWREPILAAMDRIEAGRKRDRERKLLKAVEQANLLAAGASFHTARRQAEATAEELVRTAGRPGRRVAAEPPAAPVAPAPFDPLGWAVWLLVGPHVRAVLAVALLGGCWLWAHQNGVLPWSEAGVPTEPLVIDGVPAEWTAWLDGWNSGAAGLLMLASLIYRGFTPALLVLLGTAVTVGGHHGGIRTVEPFRDAHVALMLGSVLTLVGFRTARHVPEE